MEFELDIDKALDSRKKVHDRTTAPKILCVDDEAGNLSILESLLSQSYQVYTAPGGVEALELVNKHDFAVVISDQRMPSMLGTKLLKRIKEASPFTVRILLTAYADVADIIESINSGGVYRYILKPWDANDIRLVLKNAVELSRLQKENVQLLDELKTANEELEARVLQKTKELEKAMAAKMQHTQQLSALGQQIASIGHEISNPVSLIASSEEYVKENLAETLSILVKIFATGGPEAEAISQDIQDRFGEALEILSNAGIASKRLLALSEALRSQSRIDLRPSHNLDINQIVRESLIITGGHLKLFEVEEHLSTIPLVHGHHSHIGQVATNILANAADALREKTQQLEDTKPPFIGKIRVQTRSESRDEDGVLMSFADNGPGVPEEHGEKVLQEFFTTKATGKGTGLGLSLCAKIVRNHRGTIKIGRDEELGGALFEVWLPTAGPPEESVESIILQSEEPPQSD